MASIKFSGLPTSASPYAANDIFAFANTGSAASQSITFEQTRIALSIADSSVSTDVLSDSNSTAIIQFNVGGTGDVSITSDGGTFAEGWLFCSDIQGGIGSGSGGVEQSWQAFTSTHGSTPSVISGKVGGSKMFEANLTGIGLFGTTPAAQQTITGSRGGNAALAALLTKGALNGYWIDSTSA